MDRRKMIELQKQRSEAEDLLKVLQWAREVDAEAGRSFSLAGVAERTVQRITEIDRLAEEASRV